MMADASPTIRQRELGLRLREFRTAKGLTVDDVAKELLCSPTKISRAETGARRPTLRDVRDLCRIYEIDGETSAELMGLAREARVSGWWTQYNDLNISPFIGLEQAATVITCFGMYFVPALLQTEDYAREIIKGIAPKIESDILDQRVEARMRRQGLLWQAKAQCHLAKLISVVACRCEAFCLVAGKISSHGRQWRGDGWRSADGPDLAGGAGRFGSAGRGRRCGRGGWAAGQAAGWQAAAARDGVFRDGDGAVRR